MPETTNTGDLTGVEIKSGQDYGKTVRQAIPVVGGALKTYDKASSAAEDGKLSQSEISGIRSESSAFIQSCTGAAMGIAMDPIGWLVGQGLNFLITVVQPLQDAIHFVSGDGPALSQAAGNFANIGEGLEKLKAEFEQDLRESLRSWGGDASETAGSKLAEFAKGIDGVAGQAGDISQLLHISSMIMTVIEDFIKALLTELITWLIMIWIPALAAAIPTCGASTAAAGSATAVRAGMTATRVAQQVGKLRRILDAVMELLNTLRRLVGKVQTKIARSMPETRVRVDQVSDTIRTAERKGTDPNLSAGDKMYGPDGVVGQRANRGFVGSMGDVAAQTGIAQVGYGNVAGSGPDKALRNVGGVQAAAESAEIGSEQSLQDTEDDLNI